GRPGSDRLARGIAAPDSLGHHRGVSTGRRALNVAVAPASREERCHLRPPRRDAAVLAALLQRRRGDRAGARAPVIPSVARDLGGVSRQDLAIPDWFSR